MDECNTDRKKEWMEVRKDGRDERFFFKAWLYNIWCVTSSHLSLKSTGCYRDVNLILCQPPWMMNGVSECMTGWPMVWWTCWLSPGWLSDRMHYVIGWLTEHRLVNALIDWLTKLNQRMLNLLACFLGCLFNQLVTWLIEREKNYRGKDKL